ncbi:MAG: tRNA (N(6)-L-threonylcarbamoyladenosine(37)-C(2))-methylthiotransferase MtaB [Chloroflexi bacterium]|nr:tRNA (N(6)-L-threonylcarbamoyladenosine(37)-C(2))-methylthiotransferase MtaB [Chloroflexota bacterium]
MNVALDTLGCKLNQAETEQLARRLTEAGHCLVDSAAGADVYILNTCAVTHIADSKSRHLLRLAHRLNPHAMVIATGCYAERMPGDLAGIEGVSLVVGNDAKQHLVKLLQDCSCGVSSAVSQSPELRTRTFIKIQDGCSGFCTYCIVPLVRSREKSEPADGIVAEVKQRVSEGFQEIVITGTEIGDYDDNGIDLKDLLSRILEETGVPRMRLSSLQPQEVSPDLLKLWQDNRLCPHFHLSLQSGSETVLKRMQRGYRVAAYHDAVSLIRSMVPDAAITTDVIVGFPGETEEEFAESCELCRRFGFAQIHVFPYSSRPGTEASLMSCQVNAGVKKERSRKMLAMARESAERFQKQFLGRTIPVLWETESKGVWSGFTPNYIRVYLKSVQDLANRILPVKLGEVRDDGVWGVLVDADNFGD